MLRKRWRQDEEQLALAVTDFRKDLAALGISEAQQTEWAKGVIEKCKKESKTEQQNQFLSSETATSLALGALFLIASATAANAQKGPAAKVPATSNLITFGSLLMGEMLLGARKNRPLSLDRTMLSRVIGTFTMAGVAILINQYAEQMGLGKENANRNLNAVGYAFVMATLIDFVKNGLQRTMKGIPNRWTAREAIPDKEQMAENYFTGSDFLIDQTISAVRQKPTGRTDETTPLAIEHEDSEDSRLATVALAAAGASDGDSSSPLDDRAAIGMIRSALSELGISDAQQTKLAKDLIEEIKKDNKIKQRNPFLSSETAISLALGAIFLGAARV